MLKHNFTINYYFFTLLALMVFVSAPYISYSETAKKSKDPIVITSQSLVADKKKNMITFKGSVVAKTKDMTITSDRMEVTYTNNHKIDKINAIGNVVVSSGEGKIYSNKATYYNQNEKVIFKGDPKAVDGDNVITGNKITYYLKDERVEVEGSKVFLKENVDSLAQPGH
jgi:lipopolysaccharide export system protein LptA